MTDQQKSSLIGFGKTIGTWIGTAAPFFGSIKEIKEAIDGEPSWCWLILCVGLTIAACIFVILKRERSSSLIGAERYLIPVFSPAQRTCAGIFLVVVLMAPFVFWLVKPAPEHFFKIAVADVDGPTNYGISETLITSLRKAAEKYPKVKIISLRKSISPQEGTDAAKAAGSKEGADILIWGWCKTSKIKTHINLRCEILTEKLRNWKSYTETDATRGIYQLEGFELQKELGEDMTSLALLFLGASMTVNKDYDNAFRALSDAIDHCQNSSNLNEAADIYCWRAQCERRGYVKNAAKQQIADLTEAIARNTNFVAAYICRACVFLDVFQFSEALSDCDAALRLDPGHTVALADRSVALAALGRYDEAIHDAERACKALPNENIYKMALAQAYIWKGDTDHALQICAEILSNNPKDQYALFLRADSLRRAGRNLDAIKTYSMLLNGELKEMAYFGRSQTYSGCGDFEKAAVDLSSVLKLSPESADDYYFRAQALYSSGKYELAASDLASSLLFQTNLLQISLFNIYMLQGLTFSKLERFPQAVTNFTMAIAFNSNIPDAYANRGFAYMNLGSFSNAVVDISRSLETNPNSVEFLLERACAFIGLDKGSNALLDLDRCIALTPNDFSAYGLRASAYLQLGAFPEALSDCEAALRATNDPTTLKNALSVWWAIFKRGQDTSNRLSAISENPAFDQKDAKAERLLIEAEGGSLISLRELESLAAGTNGSSSTAEKLLTEAQLYFKVYRKVMEGNRVIGDIRTGKPKDESIDVVLFEDLASKSWTQREAAVFYLAKAQKPFVVPHLCEALFSETNLYVISDITQALNEITGSHHQALDISGVSDWWATNMHNSKFHSPFLAVRGYWSGGGFFSTNGAEAALPKFNECISMAPDAYWAHSMRAGCYYSLKQLDLAEQDLRTAEKTSSHEIWWLFYRTAVFTAEGKTDQAIETLNEMLISFPEDEPQFRSIFGALLKDNTKVKWTVQN